MRPTQFHAEQDVRTYPRHEELLEDEDVTKETLEDVTEETLEDVTKEVLEEKKKEPR